MMLIPTVMISRERHGDLNHQQLDCIFNSLFSLPNAKQKFKELAS